MLVARQCVSCVLSLSSFISIDTIASFRSSTADDARAVPPTVTSDVARITHLGKSPPPFHILHFPL